MSPLLAQSPDSASSPDSAHSQLRFMTGQDPTTALSQVQPYFEWVLSPQVGVSIPMGKRVTLVTVVGYQFSFAEDPGVEPTDNVMTSEFFIFHLPDYWYSILQVNPVYIGADSRWTNVVTLQAGKFVGARHRVGPSVQVSMNSGTQMSVYPYSAQVQVAMNWLCPKGRAGGSH